MTPIDSKIDPRSPDFRDNANQLRATVEQLRAELAKVSLGGGDKARNKHTERGKLLPRERIRALLDPGSPFLELSPLAAHGMYDDAAPCAPPRCNPPKATTPPPPAPADARGRPAPARTPASRGTG